MRVGFLDLVQGPVFHLKDNQTNLLAVEQEIRFVPINVR
jgi:hypothetical protein